MIFGIGNLGRMKKHNGHFVSTRFVIIGVPLLPIDSNYHTSKYASTSLGLNYKSVLKGYSEWIFTLLSIILLIWSFPIYGIQNASPRFFLGVLTLAASIYFIFIFQKSTEEENEIRDLMNLAIGINVLPEYFNHVEAIHFKNKLLRTLKETTSISDWQIAIDTDEYTDSELPLLFAIANFQNRIIKNKDSQKRYNKILAQMKKNR